MKFMDIVIPSMEFDIYPLWTRICQLIMIQVDLRSKDWKGDLETLITTALLDYGHQFIRKFHVVNSTPQTRKIN